MSSAVQDWLERFLRWDYSTPQLIGFLVSLPIAAVLGIFISKSAPFLTLSILLIYGFVFLPAELLSARGEAKPRTLLRVARAIGHGVLMGLSISWFLPH